MSSSSSLCSDNGGSRDLIIALAYRLFLSIFFIKRFLKFLFPSALVICLRSKSFRFLAMVFLFTFRLRFL